jgi:hypothetical protein
VTPDIDGAAAYLVVGLQSEDDQVARIVTILDQVQIRADVMGAGAASLEPAAVAVRIPAERVTAAVLALEQHGFTRVRAYRAHLDR